MGDKSKYLSASAIVLIIADRGTEWVVNNWELVVEMIDQAIRMAGG